jgi:hypothetical protein
MCPTQHAAQAGVDTPTNDKARGTNAGQVAKQETGGNLNSAFSGADRKEVRPARWPTLACRCGPWCPPERYCLTCRRWWRLWRAVRARMVAGVAP